MPTSVKGTPRSLCLRPGIPESTTVCNQLPLRLYQWFSKFVWYSPFTNPNTVSSSPTKITKKIIAKKLHDLLWRNNRLLWTNDIFL